MLFVLSLVTASGSSNGNFEAKKNVVAGSYNFWIYTPSDYEPGGHPMPLVIFLHAQAFVETT